MSSATFLQREFIGPQAVATDWINISNQVINRDIRLSIISSQVIRLNQDTSRVISRLISNRDTQSQDINSRDINSQRINLHINPSRLRIREGMLLLHRPSNW